MSALLLKMSLTNNPSSSFQIAFWMLVHQQAHLKEWQCLVNTLCHTHELWLITRCKSHFPLCLRWAGQLHVPNSWSSGHRAVCWSYGPAAVQTHHPGLKLEHRQKLQSNRRGWGGRPVWAAASCQGRCRYSIDERFLLSLHFVWAQPAIVVLDRSLFIFLKILYDAKT